MYELVASDTVTPGRFSASERKMEAIAAHKVLGENLMGRLKHASVDFCFREE